MTGTSQYAWAAPGVWAVDPIWAATQGDKGERPRLLVRAFDGSTRWWMCDAGWEYPIDLDFRRAAVASDTAIKARGGLWCSCRLRRDAE